MIDKFKLAIFIVQKKTGKNELKKEDFIKILSFENRWLEPSTVEKFLEICTKINLLQRNGDTYIPSFSNKGLEIPVDFEILPEDVKNFQEKEEQDIFKIIIERIEKTKGIKKNEIVAEINKMKSKNRYFTIEVLALLYAKENGVEIKDLIPLVENSIFQKR
ncbi:MAG: DUF2240 family protein [Thermoplasmata archaeon]|nr:DUF2240 family protein [Thermoplasmata archaeon]